MESSRARWAAGGLLAVAAVVVLLPVVAVASRPERGSGAPLLGADPARLALDVVTYLFVVFIVLGLLVIVWALWPRPGDELPPLPPRRRWALSTVITTLLAVAVAVWLRAAGHLNRLPGVNPGGAGAGRALPSLPASPRGGAPPGFDWIAAVIVVVILAAGAALAWWLLRPHPRRGGRSPLARLQAVLDDAIEDVISEADPRRAVIAAWARLERVLGRYGLPRRDSEAPFEYAARASPAIGIAPVSLERLADLYEWARFSLHDVTPAMRTEALDGLVAVRDGLHLAT